MASVLHSLPVTLFFAFLLIANPTFAAVSPAPSPSTPLSPSTSPKSNSPPSPPPATPSPSPALDNSPPAPPMPDLDPNTPSPSPAPSSEKKKSPAPAPAVYSREDNTNAGDLETNNDSSGGMSGGKKAGIAFGVIGAACLAGLGVLVYKKRQLNIRRSQYGTAARREFL